MTRNHRITAPATANALSEAELNRIVGGDGKASPKSSITFEYGALAIRYVQQDASGAL